MKLRPAYLIGGVIVLLAIIIYSTGSKEPSKQKSQRAQQPVTGDVLSKEDLGYLCAYRAGKNTKRVEMCEARMGNKVGQPMTQAIKRQVTLGKQGKVMESKKKRKGKKKRNRKKTNN